MALAPRILWNGDLDGRELADAETLIQWTCHALCGSTVSWVAAESRYGWDLALEWIESKKEIGAATGWATLSSLV